MSLRAALQISTPSPRPCVQSYLQVLTRCLPPHNFSVLNKFLLYSQGYLYYESSTIQMLVINIQQTSKKHSGKKTQEMEKTKTISPDGNIDGCTQHSLLSVGLNVNQLTGQWMQTAGQKTQGNKALSESHQSVEVLLQVGPFI